MRSPYTALNSFIIKPKSSVTLSHSTFVTLYYLCHSERSEEPIEKPLRDSSPTAQNDKGGAVQNDKGGAIQNDIGGSAKTTVRVAQYDSVQIGGVR